VTWLAGLLAVPAFRLLKDALQQLGEEDSAQRARILGGLAKALLFAGAWDQAATYGQQALEMNRRVGDPAALAFNLHTMLDVLWEPEKTMQSASCLRHGEVTAVRGGRQWRAGS
jgi:ATP/maltotriose-dependent transcriptional regulator MalT